MVNVGYALKDRIERIDKDKRDKRLKKIGLVVLVSSVCVGCAITPILRKYLKEDKNYLYNRQGVSEISNEVRDYMEFGGLKNVK